MPDRPQQMLPSCASLHAPSFLSSFLASSRPPRYLSTSHDLPACLGLGHPLAHLVDGATEGEERPERANNRHEGWMEGGFGFFSTSHDIERMGAPSSFCVMNEGTDQQRGTTAAEIYNDLGSSSRKIAPGEARGHVQHCIDRAIFGRERMNPFPISNQ